MGWARRRGGRKAAVGRVSQHHVDSAGQPETATSAAEGFTGGGQSSGRPVLSRHATRRAAGSARRSAARHNSLFDPCERLGHHCGAPSLSCAAGSNPTRQLRRHVPCALEAADAHVAHLLTSRLWLQAARRSTPAALDPTGDVTEKVGGGRVRGCLVAHAPATRRRPRGTRASRSPWAKALLGAQPAALRNWRRK